jgi:hypothetical protein
MESASVKTPRHVIPWIGAYFFASLVGYALAVASITAHNLVRLMQVGAHISAADALSTFVFDFKGLSPTFGTITKYGSILFLGFAIAFATAHVLYFFLAPRLRSARLARGLFPLAGATGMAVGLAILNAQYDVSMIAGTRGITGLGMQYVAGAIAGWVFVRGIKP